MKPLSLVVTYLPGFQKLVTKELNELGLKIAASDTRSLKCFGHLNALYSLNLQLRCASEVFVELACFKSTNFKEFKENFREIPWDSYLLQKKTNIDLEIRSKSARRKHLNDTKNFAINALGKYVHPESANKQHVKILLNQDSASVLINSSGENLAERFYRPHQLGTIKAPIPCTIAASFSGIFDQGQYDMVVDPFCGSGSIVIEYLLKQLNIFPGLIRVKNKEKPFAFINWPVHDYARYREVIAKSESMMRRNTKIPMVYGFDRDAGAIQSAVKFAKIAGVGEYVRFEQSSIMNTFEDLPGFGNTGLLISNPPWGKRTLKHTKSSLIRPLYSAFGDAIRRCENTLTFEIALLMPKQQAKLLYATGLKWDQDPKLSFSSSGMRLQIYTGRIS